ncbi:MAG TPA: histidine kinase [Thermoleophilaceae bacterium]
MRTLARIWPRLTLWGPPVVLGGLGLFEIWVEPIFQPPPSFPGPAGIHTVGVLLVVAGLSVRRRAPGVALGAVSADLLLEWAYGPEVVSFTAFVGMLVAFYSVGAHCDLRRAALLLSAGLLVLVALDAVDVARGHGTVLDATGEYPFVLVVWGAGVAVRNMRLRARELEDRVGLLARERDEKARAAAARERTRIARELHDVVAHSVSTMVLQASGARQVLRSHTDEADDAMRSVEFTGRQALRELRRMLGILRTDDRPSLDPQPGVADIELLVAHMRDTGLPVELEASSAPPGLAPGLDLTAYRIVQEALTNVLKHAGRVETSVRVSFGAEALELVIRNAGPIAQLASNGGDPGHGLIGMRERVALYGGSVSARPDDGGGFTVHAWLPLEGERV